MLNFTVYGHSSAGRATVSKTVGRGFESFCPCKLRVMDKIRLYVKDSYNELVNKVTWPDWPTLQSSTIVVIIASLIIALIIFLMDTISKQSLGLIYNL